MTRIQSRTETTVRTKHGLYQRRTVLPSSGEGDTFWYRDVDDSWTPVSGAEAARLERAYLDSTVPRPSSFAFAG